MLNIVLALAKVEGVDGDDDLKKTSEGMGIAFGQVDDRVKQVVTLAIPAREAGSLPEIMKDLGERVLFRHLNEWYAQTVKEPPCES